MNKLISRWNNLSDAMKASLAFAFSSFFVRGISFLTTPIFTRIMDQTQYGIISTYNAWSTIVEVIAVLGMTSAGIINVGLNDYRDSRNQYLSNITALGNVTTLLVFGVLFVVNHIGDSEVILPDILLGLMLLHFLLYPAQIYWLTRQRYELKYKAAMIVSILSVLFGQTLAIIFVLDATGEQGTAKIISNEVGYLIVAIPIYIILLARGKVLFDKTIWKQVLLFAIPLIPHYLAQHLMSSADRIMISNMVSRADSGIYNLVYNVGWLATLIWAAIGASLSPFLYEKMNIKGYERIKNVTKSIVIFYSLLCIFIALIAPEVMKFLAPPEYYQGVFSIIPIIGVAYLNGLYNLYSSIEFYHKKTKYIALSTIIASLVNIPLNYWLIRKWSYIGAAYATLISYAVLIALHYRGYRKSQAERVFDDSFIIMWSVAIIVIGIFLSLLYNNDLGRYILIGFIIVLTIKKKEMFVNFINHNIRLSEKRENK